MYSSAVGPSNVRLESIGSAGDTNEFITWSIIESGNWLRFGQNVRNVYNISMKVVLDHDLQDTGFKNLTFMSYAFPLACILLLTKSKHKEMIPILTSSASALSCAISSQQQSQ